MNLVSSDVQIRHPLLDIFLFGLLSGFLSCVTCFTVILCGVSLIDFDHGPSGPIDTEAWGLLTGLLMFLGIPALFILSMVITISVDSIVRVLGSSTNLLRLSIVLGIIMGVLPSVGYVVYMVINIFNLTPGF